MTNRKTLIATCTAAALALGAYAPATVAGSTSQKAKQVATEFTGEAYDAWLDGKLEATYLMNRGLSAFDIETRVDAGEVLLTGEVENDAQRQLAEEIALSLKGIEAVDNQLLVKADAKARSDEDDNRFVKRVQDATLAATLKSKLVLNREIDGLQIDVDVESGKAILKGSVESRTESELAEHIAKNVDGIEAVDNQLRIASSS